GGELDVGHAVEGAVVEDGVEALGNAHVLEVHVLEDRALVGGLPARRAVGGLFVGGVDGEGGGCFVGAGERGVGRIKVGLEDDVSDFERSGAFGGDLHGLRARSCVG